VVDAVGDLLIVIVQSMLQYAPHVKWLNDIVVVHWLDWIVTSGRCVQLKDVLVSDNRGS
jgi:hypothetical protein